MKFGRYKVVILFLALNLIGHICFGQDTGIAKDTIKTMDTTNIAVSSTQAQLATDEGIKCTRGELLDKEFVAVGKSKYGEILRITFQDLERGGREIIFQKKLMENDEVKFFMPMDLIKEAKTAVLIVMKGEGMFFKKIDITD